MQLFSMKEVIENYNMASVKKCKKSAINILFMAMVAGLIGIFHHRKLFNQTFGKRSDIPFWTGNNYVIGIPAIYRQLYDGSFTNTKKN